MYIYNSTTLGEITMNQNERLIKYLRGTGRSLSAAQAESRFGIKNISARMSELRDDGFRVRTDVNTTGLTVYSVSRRKVV